MSKKKTYSAGLIRSIYCVLKNKIALLLYLICAFSSYFSKCQTTKLENLTALQNQPQKRGTTRDEKPISLSFIYEGINLDPTDIQPEETKTFSREINYSKELRSSYNIIGPELFILYSSLGLLQLIIIAFFYAQSRKNSLKRKAIEFEQMTLRTQMNPHFIFNSLNSIQRLYIEQKFDDASNYMADFSHLLRTILDNSSKRSITLKEELKHLDLYCEIEQLRTGGLLQMEYTIDPSIIPYETKVFPMLIQPFVENAIWHGIVPTKKKGIINVKIRNLEDNMIEITVQDNGIGWLLSKQSTHDSKGIELIEQRIGSKVLVEHLSPGTSITFKTRKL